MNNHDNIAATIGIGAIGSILAYYGYNKLSAKTNHIETNDNHVMDGTGIGFSNDLKNKVIENKVIENKVIENKVIEKEVIEKEVIKELNQTAIKGAKDNGDMWEKYWKNEYENPNEFD